jgi:hypothetical protein
MNALRLVLSLTQLNVGLDFGFSPLSLPTLQSHLFSLAF